MYMTPKRARRRGRLPRQARAEVQGYVQTQFSRYQKHQGKMLWRWIVLAVALSGAAGVLGTLAALSRFGAS